MKIRLKLYASLRDYLPDDAVDHAVEIDVPEDASPYSIIDRFQVPRHRTHLVLVNGVFAAPDERGSPILRDGDTLAIWPPIAGG
jgi:molybdopterin converting factor small subunit